MKCPECGSDNKEGRKFCSKCGSKLENICPECGFVNDPDDMFCGGCGARLVGATATETTIPKLEDMHSQLQSLIPEELAQKYATAEPQAAGENRPITALFADISGFTPLSSTQSSETMLQLVQECFRQLVGIVARYEGIISGFRGDGLLALFGAPILHENDAERAIRAAMDMRDAMHDRQLEVTIGINTAPMTVGEIQTQLHREYTAYGTDVILASRLQDAAEPGQILAGTGTHRLTRRIFDFEIVHDLELQGFAQPVTAYTVQQVKVHPEKLRGIEGLRARMIGREHEFAELKESADLWLSGQGQMISIIGEAGIGKSRLVAELRQYLDTRHETRDLRQEGDDTTSLRSEVPSLKSQVSGLKSILEGRCVSIGQPISYWPFIDILRTYFQFREEDGIPAIARKVTESITNLMPQGAEETLPLLGNLLSIRYDNELDDRLKFASPEQIRHQTLMRLRDMFRTLAEQQPLMLILEDLHWSDDLSLDLVSLLMDELANTPIMLLCVYRPEKEHRVWQLGDQARRKCLDRYTEIRLNPLSSLQSRQLVESLLEIENLPESTKEVILTRSEGNPFFIEEVIRSLIEQDMIYQDGDHWKAREEIANISVPDTIQSVVLARVDRLRAEAKYVLQCASVIGRLFRYRLLQHISRQEQDLDRYLAEFEEKELVYEERTVPELEYAFKHAFTQEATYEGILERSRREFHHLVAVGIERLYHERLEEYYEELAHHYSKSDDAEKAVEYLLRAGQKARMSYDNNTAASCLQKALEMMGQRAMKRDDWVLEALRGLGEVHLGIGGIEQAISSFEQAVALGERMKLSPRELSRLYFSTAHALFWESRYEEVIHYGEKGLEALGDDTECVEAVLLNSRIAVGNRWGRGDIERWLAYTQKNMAIIRKFPYSSELMPPYVHIIEACAYNRDLEAALEWSKELETRARECNDLRGLASAWMYQSYDILSARGDYSNALLLKRKTLAMFQNIGDEKHTSWCHNHMAGIAFCLGNIEEARKQAHIYLRMGERVGNPRDIANAHMVLGYTFVCQRRWDEAISQYKECLEIRRGIGELLAILSAHISLGRAYLRKNQPTYAIQSFTEAADAAIELESVLFYSALGGLEQAYADLGMPHKFRELCDSFKRNHPDASSRLPLQSWYLEPTGLTRGFPHLTLADEFGMDRIHPSWIWTDEFGDCAYKNAEAGGVEVSAANGRDLYHLNLSAPRLVMDFSGDFAVEVCISSASDDKPQQGGLLIWKDKDNFLRFERGVDGQHEMRLHGYVNGEWHIAGRGLLKAEGNEEVHLRLERSGDEFTSYCSTDGESWFTCGRMTLPMEDPIQAGIHAIGMIDRTIYCGEYKEGTATVFRNFRIWTR